MPASKPNQVARIAVPLILLAIALGLTALAFTSGRSSRSGASVATLAPPAEEQRTPETGTEQDVAEPDATDGQAREASVVSGDPAPPPEADGGRAGEPVAERGDRAAPAPASALSGVVFDASGVRALPQPSQTMPILGSLDPASGHLLRVELSASGAGVDRILSTDHFQSVADRLSPPADREHYVIQHRTVEQALVDAFGTVGRFAVTPFATRTVFINDHAIDLHGLPDAPVWRVEEATLRRARLVAELVDADNALVATIRKAVRVEEGSHLMRIVHEFVNHTDHELAIRWVHQGPVDMPTEAGGAYGGAVMRLRFGYLLNPKDDPSQTFVEADRKLQRTFEVVNRIRKGREPGRNDPNAEVLWPDLKRFSVAGRLVWFGQASRYFATVVLPEFQAGQGMSRALEAAQEVRGAPVNERLLLTMFSGVEKVPAGAVSEQRFSVYAGPISREALSAAADPIFTPGELNLRGLLVYNYGGPCSFCTFQWLASPLLTVLRFFHTFTGDWALAIIMLVLVVRTVLHPITRKAQISMLRFGKQMQKIAPKQQKIREKYKNDPKQMQAEVAKLMREEGVNPVGMLGCLPMFLQTPVWIALYAMLGFAIELRHEPAFYGLFQFLSGNAWPFLADLSMADAFIPLGVSLNIPFLSGFMGPITSINALPLLLGIVFYIQQKYLTPPTTATLTPEQEAQQKMIKVMMVVMFPVFIYNAPSGLALYFITNSTIAIFESRWIRASAEKMDLDKPSRTAELLRKQVENRAKARQARAQAPRPTPDKPAGKKRFKDR